MYGEQTAFIKEFCRWNEFEWVTYLRKHATMVPKIDDYKNITDYSRIYVTYWELPEEKLTYFYLKWGDQIGQ